MGVRKGRRITSALLIIGVLAFVTGFVFSLTDSDIGMKIALAAGFVSIAAGIIVDYFTVRCPNCDYHIGVAYGDFCPMCGSALEKDGDSGNKKKQG